MYGRMILTEAEMQQQAAAHKTVTTANYGPMLDSGEAVPDLAGLPAPEAPSGGTQFTVAEIEEILDGDPTALEELLRYEMARPEGVRKGAVAAFLAAAKALGRPAAFIATLDALIA